MRKMCQLILTISIKGPIIKAFQSTLPQGERHASRKSCCISILFQSTLPQGERLPGIFVLPSANLFQSTLPQGERPGYSGMRSDGKSRFQSTLPQGERLTEALTGYTVYGFQSTLPQGERRAGLRPGHRHNNFNPRSRKGSDPE